VALGDESADPDRQEAQQVHALQQDLSTSRQRSQAIIEEYESSKEEMKASNEEMQSTSRGMAAASGSNRTEPERELRFALR
jgi:two-component system, chemotaxis family, CheB/CheR fusion protein